MANRREFIQSGVALSAISLSAVSAWAGSACAEQGLGLERFVVDARFADAVEIAASAARTGVPVARVSGDLTDLWFNDLALLWKKMPMALAGVTTRYGLFVLETLAADHRMRVVYRGEHGISRDGRMEHVLSGPAELVEQVAGITDGFEWRARLGVAMTRCPVGKPAAAKLEATTSAGLGSRREDALFSWIIAPRSSVALRA